MKIGYFLSCEEWGPRELVTLAAKAERAGCDGHQDAFFQAYRERVLPCLR